MKENTAKNFVIQLGALITLYVSISALIVLIFGIINSYFPDEAAYMWQDEGVREGIRVSIAMLTVFFPAYLILTRISNQTRRKEENGLYSGLSKWLMYISLLVGGLIILGDLVTILVFLLNGEVTMRFILKAFTLLAIVGITFNYYLLDVRGYFKTEEKKSILFGVGITIVVLVALVCGFFNIETPAEVREMRIDEQQVSDLRDLQWRIEDYYRTNKALPENIDMLYFSNKAPNAPTNRDPYQYNITGEKTYELCATFANSSVREESYRPVTEPFFVNNYNWEHGKGQMCFERTIEESPVKVPSTVLDF